MVLSYLIDLAFNVYFIFLILRMAIHDREFFFSPFLQPVYRSTEPIFRFLHSHISYLDRRRNFSILLVLILMVGIKGVVLNFVMVQILYYSPLSLMVGNFFQRNVTVSIVLSYMNFFDLLYQGLIVLLISSLLAPQFSVNPLVRFSNTVIRPLYQVIQRLLPFIRRGLPIVTVILLMLLHIILNSGFVQILSLDLSRDLEFLGPSRTYAQSLFREGADEYFRHTLQIDYRTIIFNTLALFISALGFFTMVIIIGAIMSWFRPDPYNSLVQWIELINEPILAPFRKLIPLIGGFDLSPIAAIFLLEFSREIIRTLLSNLIFLA